MAYSDPTADNIAGNPMDRSGWFEVWVSLTGMDPDDVLSVCLPAELSGITVSQLLDHVFPPGEDEQRSVASMFDLRANPDLPEIYEVFLDAFDARRNGRCTLAFSGGDGVNLDLSGVVSRLLIFSSARGMERARESLPSVPIGEQTLNCHSEKRGDEESGEGAPEQEGGCATQPPQIPRGIYPERSHRAQADRPQVKGISPVGIAYIPAGVRQPRYPRLNIQIDQQYHAVEYATQTGFWGAKEDLLEWLQSLTFLYFLDKHEVEIPAPLPAVSGAGLTAAAARLQSKGLISTPGDSRSFVITEEGRGFIGRLLSETESYIDLYDHFKDTSIDPDGESLDEESVEFGTGRGVDLRVQVFLAEGLDPLRTVFLLRLYDGALDCFVPAWEPLIEEESFFDGILEPVVNCCEVDEALISEIVDAGYGFLEERAERHRELESQQEIIKRLWA